ncbi:MAG: DUF721 domain-containing protein [Candidatus Dormibacteria bacterium]
MDEQRVSDLLDPTLRSLGVRGRVREEQVRTALAQVVGPAMAPLCGAERLERGTLLITTSSTALAHQLQLESPRIIESLNAALGAPAVKRLRFGPR